MLKNGAGGYLTKNIIQATFCQAITELYTSGFYHSDIVVEKFPRITEKRIDDLAMEIMFTEKEILFLSLCCSELSYKEISDKMNLSHRTIENYSAQLFERLDIHSRIGLAMYAQRAGIGFFSSMK